MKTKARVIAFYLPQYHPIPENDEWWGPGFTEWRNVVQAKPLFKGHYQPHIPADLGFYDLRLQDTRDAQAKLAKEAGIEGFCYWHYWFDREHKLLERPFDEVLKLNKPDYPFCIGWANHSWTNKTWKKDSAFRKDSMLMEQKYDTEDYIIHFNELLPAFKDPRYIKVDGKLLFVIFAPNDLPRDFIPTWRKLAKENGLSGFHFVGICENLKTFDITDDGKKIYRTVKGDESAMPMYNKVFDKDFDAVNSRGLVRAELLVNGRLKTYITKALRIAFKISLLRKFQYKEVIKYLYTKEDSFENVYPTLLPNWDRSPRSGKDAVIYHDSSPQNFELHLKNALDIIKNKSTEHRLLFLMSWNEWGEGNYVEPDLKYGKGYLDVLKKHLK